MPPFWGSRRSKEDRLEVTFGAPITPPLHVPGETWSQAEELVQVLRRAVEGL